MPCRFPGAFHPVTTSVSLRLNVNARGDMLETIVLKEGGLQYPSKAAFLSWVRRLWLLSLRDDGSHNPINELSALTGHRGHCLLTQPGQEPCHLQEGVHTFCYFHMSVSNFLKNKSNLNLLSKWGRSILFKIWTNGLFKIDAMNSTLQLENKLEVLMDYV